VTAALKVAIDALGASRPAQIVMVGDAADNCRQDPCAVASDFSKTSPGVPIQVIGIGVPASDQPRLACVAEATGGRFYDITDSDGLDAALDEAMKLAILTPETPAAASKKPVAPPPPSGASVRVSASLAKDGALLTVPLRWRIFKAGEKTAAGQTVGPDISAKLAAGSYDVEAQLGSVMARQQITVSDGGAAQSLVLPLDAGHLKITASANKGGAPSPTAILTVASGDAPVAIGRNGTADLYLPPADYTIAVEDGIARAHQSVSLAAGDDKPVAIALGTGRVELSATSDSNDNAIDDIVYTIFEDDPYSPTGRREIARSRAAKAMFTLPSGTYYVSARSGGAEVRERIALGIGETVTKVLALAVTPLKLSALVAGVPATASQGIVYRIDRLDGDKARVGRAVGPDAAFSLPPGHYSVSASLAAYPLSATQDITLESGKPAAITLRIEGGTVSFKPPEDLALSGDIYWEVLDGKGAPVWRKTGGDATTLLAPGHYKVRFEAHGQRKETTFEVRAGETKEIEISQG
jgi:Ca-activated chloride channel family protein